MKTNCKNCKKIINRKPSEIKKGGNLFCSKECFNKYKPSIITIKCGTCKKEIKRFPSEIKKSKTGNLYCSKRCSAIQANKSRFGKGHASYRRQAFEAADKIECEKCGWDKEIDVLQVHHIDRNRRNHSINNLQILCPNCHLLEHYYSGDGAFTK